MMSRDEIYLNAILTGDTSNLPTPISRVDEYLYQIAMRGTSGSGGTSITIDSELSETSINPVQNRVITTNLGYVWTDITDIKSTNATLQSQINTLNSLISNLPNGETVTTVLFDNANYSNYLNWNFLIDQWGNTVYSFEQAIAHTSSICSDSYSNQLRLSTDIGWSANVQFICLTPLEINSNSRLLVNYSCSTTGSDIAIDVLSSPDFNAEPVATFEDIPSILVNNDAYMSVNLFPTGSIENGTYYLRFKYTTINPIFLIKSIKLVG